MYNQFFGQFLLQRGMLTAEQLCQAFQDENGVRVKLGVLAIDKGFMTAPQVDEVHNLQKMMDKRFGDIAVAKGYIEEKQLDELLQAQRLRHLSLSQAIIDRGYLDLHQLTAALQDYKQESMLASVGNKDDYDELAWLLLDFKGVEQQENELYHDYIGLFLRNVVRFLQLEPVLERDVQFNGQTDGWLVSQVLEFRGHRLLTGLVLSDEALVRLAAIYSQENITQVDELALDAVSEFLNVHNGTFNINLSNSGVEAVMLPQKIEESAQLALKHGFCIPVVVPFGRINVIVGLAAES